jgi:hypothetical protein
MDARSTPPTAQDRPAVLREDALLEDARSRAAPGDDRKDPAPLDFAALMRRVEAEVYNIS